MAELAVDQQGGGAMDKAEIIDRLLLPAGEQAAGLWFLHFGARGATAATLLAGFPPALVAAVAGLALTPALVSALTGALAEPDERTGAVFALPLTAADIHPLGGGAPCVGLVLGALTGRLMRRVAR